MRKYNPSKTPITLQEALNYVNDLEGNAMLKQPEIIEKLIDIHVNKEKHWTERSVKRNKLK